MRRHSTSNSTANDMWNNLINNPMPNPSSPTASAQSSNSSPSQAPGFTRYASHPQPFQQYANYPQYPSYIPFQQTPPPFANPQFQQTPPPFANPQFQQTPPPFANPQFQQSMGFSPFPPTPINYPQFGGVNSPPEHVPETDPEPEPVPSPTTKAKGKAKAKGKEKGKRVQVKWSDDEAAILAERWIHCSEKSLRGVSQSYEAFWETVLTDYNKVAPQERTLSQIQGKWNKIRGDCKIFIGLHKHLSTPRQSGASDDDIIRATHEAFKSQQGRTFIYEKCWNVLRYCPKFSDNDGMMSRQQHQSQVEIEPEPINLGDDMPTSEPLATNMERLFQNDMIRRPPGRDKAKKSQRSSGSSDAATSSRSLKEKERLANIEAAEAQKATLATIDKNSIKKTILKSWKLLFQKVPKGVKGKQKKMIKDLQNTVINNYENDYKTVFGFEAGTVQANDSSDDEDENEDESDSD